MAIASFLVLGFIIFWNFRPVAPPYNFTTAEAIGAVLAEELSQRLPAGGTVLILAPAVEFPESAAQLRSLRARLDKLPGFTVAGVERLEDLQVKPNSAGVWPAEAARASLEKHPEVTAVISLVGCPELRSLTVPARQSPLWMALASRGPAVRDLLVEGRLAVAIMPKHILEPPPAGEVSDARRQLLRTHDILTRENADLLDF